MKLRWSIAGMGVPFLLGCSAGVNMGGKVGVPGERVKAARASSAATEERAVGSAREAGRPSRAVPGGEFAMPGLDDRFEVERQVAALERSVALYQTFIDRAGDDPQFGEAVRRSKNRMEDARVTICFLLEKPCGAAENP